MTIDAYLTGLYAPVPDERTDSDLTVTGEIPEALEGLFVQSNPNPRHEPTGPYHWFDGDGMLHGVVFREGRATYRNRYIGTDKLAEETQADKALYNGILMPFDPGNDRPDPETANTHCVTHNGELLALWWLGGTPVAVDHETLETRGKRNYGGGVAAHAKTDPRTGELVFLDYSPYRRPYLQVGFASADGTSVRRVPIDLPGPRLLHDLAITPDYVVVLDFPMQWDPGKLAQGKRRVTFDRQAPSRLGLLSRDGKDTLQWFESPACYSYHVVNAWQDGDEVVVIACRIDDPVPTKRYEDDPGVPRLTFLRLEPFVYEWRLNTATGAVRERQLDDVPTEFPRSDDRRMGEKTRFAYHPRVAREPTLLFDACIRYDFEGGPTQTFEWGPQRFSGETVFAPDPTRTGEAEGWVLTYVQDRREGTTDLVILDAHHVDQGPVATVHLPRRVPVGFHSHFMPK